MLTARSRRAPSRRGCLSASPLPRGGSTCSPSPRPCCGRCWGIDHRDLASGERVAFTENVEEAWERVASGRFRLAFLVNPTRVGQVLEVAASGELLPQKSTFFYPKLGTGLVLDALDGA